MNASEHLSSENPRIAYLNPPVVEALCEVYFSSSNWNDDVPDKFFEKVRQGFPRLEKHLVHRTEITVDDDNVKTDSQSEPSRSLFFSKQDDQVIQISENLLVFNQLTPYQPFSEWQSYFYDAVAQLREFVALQTMERIGVRFMNRIEIPSGRVHMEDFFTISPTLPKGCGEIHGSFLTRYEIPQLVDKHLLTVTFNSTMPDQPVKGRSIFVLDLHAQATLGVAFNDDYLREQIRLAHGNVMRAFEGSITDNLRDLFKRKTLP